MKAEGSRASDAVPSQPPRWDRSIESSSAEGVWPGVRAALRGRIVSGLDRVASSLPRRASGFVWAPHVARVS